MCTTGVERKNYGRALRARPQIKDANDGRDLGAQFKGAVRGEGWVRKTWMGHLLRNLDGLS